MVELPKYPRRLVTTEAPKSLISGSDVAQPMTSFAKAIGGVAEGVGDAAIVLAENEGHRAVTRDEQGKLQVSIMPDFFGRAGRVHNAIAQKSYLAQLTPEIHKQAFDAGMKFDGKPDEFASWGQNYLAELRARQPNPELANAVGQQAQQVIDQTLRGLQSRRYDLDGRRQDASLDARLKTLDEEYEILNRQNAPQPARDAKMAEIKSVQAAMMSSPRGVYTPAQAERDLDAIQLRALGGTIRQGMEVKLGSEGYLAAQQFLEDALKGIPETDRKKGKLRAEGMALLRAHALEMRADRDSNKAEWAAAKRTVTTQPESELLRMQQRALETVDWRTAREIGDYLSARGHRSRLNELPEEQKREVLRTGQVPADWNTPQQRPGQAPRPGGPAPQQNIPTPGAGQGPASSQIPAGWNITTPQSWIQDWSRSESRGNPSAKNPRSSAAGVIQATNDTWLRVLEKKEPWVFEGRTRQEVLDLRVPHTGWSKDQATALGLRVGGHLADMNAPILHRAGIPITKATLFGAHFLGAAGARRLYSVPANTPVELFIGPEAIRDNPEVFARAKTAGQLIEWVDYASRGSSGALPVRAGTGTTGPAAPADWGGRAPTVRGEGAGFQIARQQEIDEQHDKLTEQIAAFKRASAASGYPSMAEVNDMWETAIALGKPEHIKAAKEVMIEAASRALASPMTQAQQDEFADQLQQEADARPDRAGHKFAVARKLREWNARVRQDYESKPWEADVVHGKGPAFPPIEWGDPAQSAQVMADKEKRQTVIRAERGVGPFSLLRESEKDSFANYVAGADAAHLTATFKGFSKLSDDVLYATLHDDKIKTTLQGALRSTDTAKFGALMTGLDGLRTRLPDDFRRLVGDDARERLAEWQVHGRYLAPKEFAEHLRRLALEEPHMKQQREDLERASRTTTTAMTTEQIVHEVTKAEYPLAEWSVAAPVRWATQALVGSYGVAPVDPQQGAAIRADYAAQRARLVGMGVSPDAADAQSVKLIRDIWKVSPTNGYQVMRNSPESVYRKIVENPDYMKKHVEDEVTRWLGPQYPGGVRPPTTDGGLMTPQPNWTYSLVADRQTEAEASAYDKTRKSYDPRLPRSVENDPDKPNTAPSYLLVVRDFGTSPSNPSALAGKRINFNPDDVVAKQDALFAQRNVTAEGLRDRMHEVVWGPGQEMSREFGGPPEGPPESPVAAFRRSLQGQPGAQEMQDRVESEFARRRMVSPEFGGPPEGPPEGPMSQEYGGPPGGAAVPQGWESGVRVGGVSAAERIEGGSPEFGGPDPGFGSRDFGGGFPSGAAPGLEEGGEVVPGILDQINAGMRSAAMAREPLSREFGGPPEGGREPRIIDRLTATAAEIGTALREVAQRREPLSREFSGEPGARQPRIIDRITALAGEVNTALREIAQRREPLSREFGGEGGAPEPRIIDRLKKASSEMNAALRAAAQAREPLSRESGGPEREVPKRIIDRITKAYGEMNTALREVAQNRESPPLPGGVKMGPPALRAWASTMAGDTSKITEDFFRPAEIEILRGITERQLEKGKKTIGYADYGEGVYVEETGPIAGSTDAIMALTDPARSLAYTLGNASIRKEEDGTIVITDKYDLGFRTSKVRADEIKSGGTFAVLSRMAEGFGWNGLLGAAHLAGGLVAPEGEGREVEIRIPPRESLSTEFSAQSRRPPQVPLPPTDPRRGVPGRQEENEWVDRLRSSPDLEDLPPKPERFEYNRRASEEPPNTEVSSAARRKRGKKPRAQN